MKNKFLHITLFFIIVSIFVTKMTRNEAYIGLSSGDVFHMEKLKGFKKINDYSNLSIQLKSFEIVKHHNSDQIKEYVSDVEIIDGTAPIKRGLIRVNHPLYLNGLNIYQDSWEKRVRHIELIIKEKELQYIVKCLPGKIAVLKSGQKLECISLVANRDGDSVLIRLLDDAGEGVLYSGLARKSEMADKESFEFDGTMIAMKSVYYENVTVLKIVYSEGNRYLLIFSLLFILLLLFEFYGKPFINFFQRR